jgi:hypothetical protein
MTVLPGDALVVGAAGNKHSIANAANRRGRGLGIESILLG